MKKSTQKLKKITRVLFGRTAFVIIAILMQFAFFFILINWLYRYFVLIHLLFVLLGMFVVIHILMRIPIRRLRWHGLYRCL